MKEVSEMELSMLLALGALLAGFGGMITARFGPPLELVGYVIVGLSYLFTTWVVGKYK